MAVYTHASDAAIARFLEDYPVGRLVSSQGITEGVENSNYLLTTEQNGQRVRYILTLYEKRVKERDLPFFLGLMQHLARKNILCPLPMVRADGALYAELEGRPAALTGFLNGCSVRRVELEHVAELGQAMAALHLSGEDFGLSRENDLSPFALAPLTKSIIPRADRIADGLADALCEEIDYLKSHEELPIARGVIHADLFTDNVFFPEWPP